MILDLKKLFFDFSTHKIKVGFYNFFRPKILRFDHAATFDLNVLAMMWRFLFRGQFFFARFLSEYELSYGSTLERKIDALGSSVSK